MKKLSLILVALAFVLMPVFAHAACDVTVTLTVSTDPNAAVQKVFYDPDNTVGGDEYIPTGCQGDMTMVSCSFQIPASVANDVVWVQTENSDGSDIDVSQPWPVTSLEGSTVTVVTSQCSQ